MSRWSPTRCRKPSLPSNQKSTAMQNGADSIPFSQIPCVVLLVLCCKERTREGYTTVLPGVRTAPSIVVHVQQRFTQVNSSNLFSRSSVRPRLQPRHTKAVAPNARTPAIAVHYE